MLRHIFNGKTITYEFQRQQQRQRINNARHKTIDVILIVFVSAGSLQFESSYISFTFVMGLTTFFFSFFEEEKKINMKESFCILTPFQSEFITRT